MPEATNVLTWLDARFECSLSEMNQGIDMPAEPSRQEILDLFSEIYLPRITCKPDLCQKLSILVVQLIQLFLHNEVTGHLIEGSA